MNELGTISEPESYLPSEVDSIRWFANSCRRPRLRTMKQFAEDEVIIPEGPRIGTRYRAHTQPFSGMLLDEFDSGRWRRYATTGCVQSGKTFSALVIPLLYFLFEKQEDVIIGVPQMEVAADKWKKEFLPTILAVPKFAELLPDKGKGSKGGKFESMTFKNGVTVKFMSGRGGDETRSGYTARIVIATEVDKYDIASETSRESDPITQMESRTRSWAEQAQIFLECTVSIPRGRIWSEYTQGSQSKIVCKCPHCAEYVHMSRADFTGFEDARTEKEAKQARFHCPNCRKSVTDIERTAMNRAGIVLHGEQTALPSGEVVGELPETDTLGFRWDAFNNLFWSSSFLGQEEFKESRNMDDESGSKEGAQFRWTIPWRGDEESIELRPEDVQRRQSAYARGEYPPDVMFVTVGIDVNKPILHWSAIAWLTNGTAAIIDYGKKATECDKYGEDIGYKRAVLWLYENLGHGWTSPDYLGVCIDARYQSGMVFNAVDALADQRWHLYFGMGSGHMDNVKYNHPKKRSRTIIDIGRRCYSFVVPEQYGSTVCINADANEWKTELHERFTRRFEDQESSEGGFTIFSTMHENEHKTFARHLTAEHQTEKFIPDQGLKRIWVAERKSNHWLDSTYMQLPLATMNGFEFKEQTGQPVVESVPVLPMDYGEPNYRERY